MLKNRNRRRPMAEINVVPYIDVMLVLLVIFMMTAPLLTQGVNVNLPKVSAQTINQNLEEPLIISVDAHGDYFLNVTSTQNEKIAPTELGKRVESQLAIEKTKHLNPTVLVKGDKNVNYGKIIEAMVLLQQAGIAQVGLITEPPSQNA